MVIDDFYSSFTGAVSEKNLKKAHSSMIRELGRLLVIKRPDFIELMNESGVPAMGSMSDSELINLYVENVPKNKNLMLGTSLLINTHNSSNFDGTLDDGMVKEGYGVMRAYYSNEFSNADGAGILGNISNIAQSAGNVISGAQANAAKKKYGVQDLVSKKEDTKQQLIQSVVAGQQAASMEAQKKADQKAATTKTLIIAGAGLLLVTIIAVVIVKRKK